MAKQSPGEQTSLAGLFAGALREALKAKRAEAKAIRAALPTKSEAKRIAKERGGFVVDQSRALQPTFGQPISVLAFEADGLCAVKLLYEFEDQDHGKATSL